MGSEMCIRDRYNINRRTGWWWLSASNMRTLLCYSVDWEHNNQTFPLLQLEVSILVIHFFSVCLYHFEPHSRQKNQLPVRIFSSALGDSTRQSMRFNWPRGIMNGMRTKVSPTTCVINNGWGPNFGNSLSTHAAIQHKGRTT